MRKEHSEGRAREGRRYGVEGRSTRGENHRIGGVDARAERDPRRTRKSDSQVRANYTHTPSPASKTKRQKIEDEKERPAQTSHWLNFCYDP